MFRTTLTRIGELRSLLPIGVPVMALTAMATKPLRHSVMLTVGIQSPKVIAINPCKANVKYAVSSFQRIVGAFRPVVERLRAEWKQFPRMLIYARSYNTCADKYLYLKTELGPEFY